MPSPTPGGGEGDFTETAIKKLLPIAGRAGLKVCLFVEQMPRVMRPGNVANGVAEVSMTLATLGSDPAYLKVAGRPVIFLHDTARDQLGNAGWAQVLLDLQQMMAPGVLAIGDIEDGTQPSDTQVFDGLHYNNPAARIAQLVAAEPRARMSHEMRVCFHQGLAQAAIGAARAHGRIAVVTVSPGIDDTELRLPADRTFSVAREGGQFYEDSWNAALAANPDWVLIQSYNQWHDGTEIEPSVEFRDQYLKLTAQYAARFHGGATAQSLSPMHHRAGVGSQR